MNLYEHTIVTRQDTTPTQIKQLMEKYSKIVEKNDGNIVQTENWGLLQMSYAIKKNKRGNYIHLKIEGKSEIIAELEKNERIDKNLLRYMTVKVKKFDLKTNYFFKPNDGEKISKFEEVKKNKESNQV